MSSLPSITMTTEGLGTRATIVTREASTIEVECSMYSYSDYTLQSQYTSRSDRDPLTDVLRRKTMMDMDKCVLPLVGYRVGLSTA